RRACARRPGGRDSGARGTGRPAVFYGDHRAFIGTAKHGATALVAALIHSFVPVFPRRCAPGAPACKRQDCACKAIVALMLRVRLCESIIPVRPIEGDVAGFGSSSFSYAAEMIVGVFLDILSMRRSGRTHGGPLRAPLELALPMELAHPFLHDR